MTAQPVTTAEIIAWWRSLTFVGFDIESTGTDVETDRTVTATLAIVRPEMAPIKRTWVIDPGIPIPAEAAAVHGWTTERLRDAIGVYRDPAEPIGEIANLLAGHHERRTPVVIYNAQYDLTLFDRELERHNLPPLRTRASHGRGCAPIIDPRVLDKHLDPYRKAVCECGCGATDKTLLGVCRHYGVPLSEADAHSSDADALAAVALVPAIIERHAQRFRGFTVEGLHDAQVVWWRKAQLSFAEWNRTKNGGKYTGIRPEWPMIPRDDQAVLS